MRVRTKNKEVAVRPTPSVPAVPGTPFRRFGNIGIQDMEIPALKLLQGLSPEVKANHQLRAGRFYHTILEEDLDEELKVIVLLVHHSVVLRSPKNVRGVDSQVLARSADGVHWDKPNQRFEVQLQHGGKVEWFTGRDVLSSRLLDWGSSDPQNKNSTPAAQHVYTVIMRLLEPQIEGPVIYTGSVTANKKIMQLNSKIELRAAQGINPLAQVYRMWPEERQGGQGISWFVPNFTADGQLPDGDPRIEEFTAQAERLDALYPSIKVVGGGDLDDSIPHAGASNAAF
jgi:hypothetical protein